MVKSGAIGRGPCCPAPSLVTTIFLLLSCPDVSVGFGTAPQVPPAMVNQLRQGGTRAANQAALPEILGQSSVSALHQAGFEGRWPTSWRKGKVSIGESFFSGSLVGCPRLLYRVSGAYGGICSQLSLGCSSQMEVTVLGSS